MWRHKASLTSPERNIDLFYTKWNHRRIAGSFHSQLQIVCACKQSTTRTACQQNSFFSALFSPAESNEKQRRNNVHESESKCPQIGAHYQNLEIKKKIEATQSTLEPSRKTGRITKTTRKKNWMLIIRLRNWPHFRKSVFMSNWKWIPISEHFFFLDHSFPCCLFLNTSVSSRWYWSNSNKRIHFLQNWLAHR